MNQNIIATAVFFVICLSNASAQDSLQVNASIVKKFESEFSDTSEVEWTKIEEGFAAKFLYRDNLWLAYFDDQGEILASGRKIKSFHQLPLQVQEGVLRERRKHQRKFGTLESGYALEMIDHDMTRYFIPMENEKVALIVALNPIGTTSITRKTLKSTMSKPARELIVKNY